MSQSSISNQGISRRQFMRMAGRGDDPSLGGAGEMMVGEHAAKCTVCFLALKAQPRVTVLAAVRASLDQRHVTGLDAGEDAEAAAVLVLQ